MEVMMSALQGSTVFGGVAVPGVLYGPSAFVTAPHIADASEINPWMGGLSLIDSYSLAFEDHFLAISRTHYLLRARFFDDMGTSSVAAAFRAIQDVLPAMQVDFGTLSRRTPGERASISNIPPLSQMERDIKRIPWHILSLDLPDHEQRYFLNVREVFWLVKRLIARQPDGFAELLYDFQSVRKAVFDHGRSFPMETREDVMSLLPVEVALIHFLASIQVTRGIDELSNESVGYILGTHSGEGIQLAEIPEAPPIDEERVWKRIEEGIKDEGTASDLSWVPSIDDVCDEFWFLGRLQILLKRLEELQ